MSIIKGKLTPLRNHRAPISNVGLLQYELREKRGVNSLVNMLLNLYLR